MREQGDNTPSNWTNLCHHAVGCGTCRDGKTESEKKAEARIELDHDDSSVDNECEEASDSDAGGKKGWGENAVEGGIIYPGARDQWRMTGRMM